MDAGRVADEPPRNCGTASLDQVRPQDPEVVVGDVREGRAALDVPDGEYAGGARLELLVDLDESLRVEPDPRGLEAEPLGVGHAPCRGEKVRALDHALAAPGALDGQEEAPAGSLRRLDGLRLEEHLDAVLPENRGDLGRDVGILLRQELAAALNDGHEAPEAPEHLSELEADVPPAQDEQVRRRLTQLHDRGRIERREILD